MTKLTLDEKKYKLLVKKYKYIFKAINVAQNHFDYEKKMAGFCLTIVDSLSSQCALEIYKNKAFLQDLFNNFYQNPVFMNAYKSIEKNIDAKVDEANKFFEKFTNSFLAVFSQITKKQQVFDILLTGLNYVLFNCLPCKINSDIEANIMNLEEYEKQKAILVKNVKLFAKLKSQIVNYFLNNSNHIICLVLGLSQRFFDI